MRRGIGTFATRVMEYLLRQTNKAWRTAVIRIQPSTMTVHGLENIAGWAKLVQ